MADKELSIKTRMDISESRAGEQQLISGYDKIRSSITSLSQVSARSFENRKKEILEEIALNEKLNQITYQRSKGRATYEYQQAVEKEKYYARSPEELRRGTANATGSYQTDINKISTSYNEAKEQNRLLRELIETVKQTSKQEIREGAINEERVLDQELKPEHGNLPAVIEKKGIAKRDTESDFSRTDFRRFANVANVASAKGGIDLAATAASTGGGILSSIGGVGGAAGMIAAIGAGKLISVLGASASQYEKELSEAYSYGRFNSKVKENPNDIFSKVRRANISDISPNIDYKNLSEMGFDIHDYTNMGTQINAMSKAGRGTTNEMAITATGLSVSDISSMKSLQRYGGGDISTQTEYFRKFLDKTEQDFSVLPEIIQQFTNATSTLVNETGKAETTRIATLYTGFQSQTGLRGELASSTFGQLEQGMQRSSNPVVQSMQLRAAREAAGSGASFWQVEKIMAAPFAKENEKYLTGFLDSIKKRSGGGEGYERALSNILQINPNIAVKLAKWNGRGDVNDILDDKSFDFTEEKKAKTGNILRSEKYYESQRIDKGFGMSETIASAMNSLVTNIQGLINELKGEGGIKYRVPGQMGYTDQDGKWHQDIVNSNDKNREMTMILNTSLDKMEKAQTQYTIVLNETNTHLKNIATGIPVTVKNVVKVEHK